MAFQQAQLVRQATGNMLKSIPIHWHGLVKVLLTSSLHRFIGKPITQPMHLVHFQNGGATHVPMYLVVTSMRPTLSLTSMELITHPVGQKWQPKCNVTAMPILNKLQVAYSSVLAT